MAVELPTVFTLLDANLWRRSRPILSGQEDDDADAGCRGVNRALNHAFAYRTRLLTSHWPSDDNPELSSSSLSTAGFVPVLTIPWRRAPWVVDIRGTLWVAGGTWRINGFGTSSGTLVGTTPTEIEEVANAAGSDNYSAASGSLVVECQRTALQSAEIYGWEIVEVELVALGMP